MLDKGQSPRAFKDSREDVLDVPGRVLGYCNGKGTLRGGKGGGGGRESCENEVKCNKFGGEVDSWVLFWPNCIYGATTTVAFDMNEGLLSRHDTG